MNINDYIIQTWLSWKNKTTKIFENISSEIQEIIKQFNYEKLIEVVHEEIKKVEENNPDKKGFDKKQIALIAICSSYDLLDERYKFPDIIDSIAKEKIIPELIDLVVKYLNDHNLWSE